MLHSVKSHLHIELSACLGSFQPGETGAEKAESLTRSGGRFQQSVLTLKEEETVGMMEENQNGGQKTLCVNDEWM